MKTFSNSILFLATSIAIASSIVKSAPPKPPGLEELAKHRTCKALRPTIINFDNNNYKSSKLLPLTADKTAMQAGITFSGFYGLNNDEKGGIEPSSAPNQIVGGAVNGLLQGNHTMQVQPGNPSQVQYFDLNSFSFGCTLITNDVLGLLPGIATDCTMTMIGYYMGEEIGKKTYQYKPDGQMQADSEKVVMNDVTCHQDFKGVDMIQFELDNKLLKVINLDTFNVTPHTCKPKKP